MGRRTVSVQMELTVELPSQDIRSWLALDSVHRIMLDMHDAVMQRCGLLPWWWWGSKRRTCRHVGNAWVGSRVRPRWTEFQLFFYFFGANQLKIWVPNFPSLQPGRRPRVPCADQAPRRASLALARVWGAFNAWRLQLMQMPGIVSRLPMRPMPGPPITLRGDGSLRCLAFSAEFRCLFIRCFNSGWDFGIELWSLRYSAVSVPVATWPHSFQSDPFFAPPFFRVLSWGAFQEFSVRFYCRFFPYLSIIFEKCVVCCWFGPKSSKEVTLFYP